MIETGTALNGARYTVYTVNVNDEVRRSEACDVRKCATAGKCNLLMTVEKCIALGAAGPIVI